MKITVEFDFDDGEYVMMVSSHGMRPVVAGPRLFRAPPHPDIKFRHAERAEAEKDARLLRAYLEQIGTRKQTKKELREVGA